MLVLDTTSKIITAVLSAAPATNQPNYVVAWADNNGTTFTEGASDGTLNGTSTVTMVASPAASTRRVIKSINIQNTDTAQITVTVGYYNGTNTRVIAKATLSVGDTWTTDATFDSNGQIKTTSSGGGGSGTVTSVAATVPSFLSVSGSPITTSGTLAISYSGTALPVANGGSGATTAQSAINTFAGAVTSGSYLRGNGTNVVMSTIQATDVPTLNQNTTGTAANITATSNSTLTTLSSLSLPGSQVSGNISGNAANVTGTVAIANGGTGQTTASAAFNALSPITSTGDLILGNGTNSATRLAIGASTYVLTSNGTTASWAAPSGGGSGTVTSVAALTLGTTGTDLSSSVANSTTTPVITLNVPTASATNRGALSSTDWTTFNNKGTVTSVAATVPSFLTVTGSPITSSGTLAISLASTPANGQLLIGNGTGLSYATLTAGTGITITNGSGSIQIDSTGGGGGTSFGSVITTAQGWNMV